MWENSRGFSEPDFRGALRKITIRPRAAGRDRPPGGPRECVENAAQGRDRPEWRYLKEFPHIINELQPSAKTRDVAP
jgi:hypothetical protein